MRTSETVLLNKFNQIIESNFHKPDFSIDEICVELGTSRSRLYRHIKEQTGLSTSLYIRRRKLLRAKLLLESTEMKTVEIAYQLGIDSPQNFSKYFVQEFGITPTAYRKEITNGKLASVDKSGEDNAFAKKDSDTVPQDIPELPFPVVPKQPTRLPGKFLYAGIVLIVCLVGALYIGSAFSEKQQVSPETHAFSGNSVAIMPFRNLGTPESAYFSEGIMDQIHGSLSLINKLKVISTTSSGKYKDSPKLAPQIAKELDVNYLLEGSVLQTKEKIRINVELIRAYDDRSVWTKSYDGDTRDIFGFLNIVSKEVADELDQKISQATEEKLGRVPTLKPEAYHEYLKANHLIESRKKEELAESIRRLTLAIKLDPEFADAYASLGQAYHLSGESDFIDEQMSFRMTEQNSLKAIRLDAENALAYANLANIYRVQSKWEQAKTAYEIALKFSPNDALVNYWYSLLLRSTGNLKEAVRYSSKAVALDPLHHVIFGGHVKNCVLAGELALAKEQLDEGRVLFGNSFVYNWVLGGYFAAKKDYRQAVRYLAKANQLNPKIKSIRYEQAFYKGMAGDTSAVKEFLSELPDVAGNYISMAAGYAGLGDKKQSLSYLQKASDLGIIPTDVKVSPFFAPLRGEPQYQAILAKFGL